MKHLSRGRQISRRMLLTRSAIAGVGAAGLALVGCGDDDDEEEAAAAPEPAAQEQQAQAPEVQPPPETGGRVVIASSAEPSILDQTVSSDPRQYLNGNLFQPLVWLTHDLKTEPMVAESWEQVEPTVWRFRIRDGIKFHNGEPLTAEDVVASLQYQLDPERAADQINLLGPITDVRLIDERNVDVVTEAISASQPARMSFAPIVPRSIIESDPESLESRPVGSGPYKFDNWTRGSELSITRFDDYWGPSPFFDDAIFRFIPETNVQLQALKAGEIDLASLSVDLAKEAPELIALEAPSILGIRIDTVAGPTADFRVRLALNLAVNRQEIIDTLYGGFGMPFSQVVPPTSPGYLPELEAHPYDPDRARELINEAGADGATLSMLCWADSGDRQFCEAVVPMFEAIGLNIDLQFGDFDTWLTEGIFGNPARGYADPVDLLVMGHSDTIGDAFRQWDTIVLCESHYGTMCDPELEALVEEARQEPDLGKALILHETINRRLYEDTLPWVMIKTSVDFWGASEGLQFTGHPEGYWTVFKMSRNA